MSAGFRVVLITQKVSAWVMVTQSGATEDQHGLVTYAWWVYTIPLTQQACLAYIRYQKLVLTANDTSLMLVVEEKQEQTTCAERNEGEKTKRPKKEKNKIKEFSTHNIC